MATIDFPSSPTVGQEYPFGDFIYVWDGVKWTTKVIVGSTEESDARYVNVTGDTMTGELLLENAAFTIPVVLKSDKGGGLIRGRFMDNSESWYVGMSGATENNVALANLVSGGYIMLAEMDDVMNLPTTHISNPVSDSPQIQHGSALTRKDYVDEAIRTGTVLTSRSVMANNESWGTQSDHLKVGSASAPHGSGRTEYCNWIQWGYNGGQKMRHTLWCPADTTKMAELWFASQINTTDTDGPATHWRVFHQGFAPTALEVGAVPREEFDTIVNALMSRIEALEAQIASTLVM